MSFFGFIANGWFVAIFLIAAVVCLFITIEAIKGIKELGKTIAIVFFIVMIICIVGMIFSQTHRVIPVNTKALVVDWTQGKVIGSYDSGLIKKPFFASVYKFPASEKYEAKIIYYPSVKGGYEIQTTFGIFINAKEVDWKKQFARYNVTNLAKIADVWHDLTKDTVSVIIKDYSPQEITGKRKEIADRATEEIKKLFEEESIPVITIELVNWDFTDPNVKTAFGAAVIAQTQQATAQAKLDAVDIQIQTIQRLAEGQKIALDKLGLTDQGAITSWLTINYLGSLEKPPENIILSTGNSSNIVPAINTSKDIKDKNK